MKKVISHKALLVWLSKQVLLKLSTARDHSKNRHTPAFYDSDNPEPIPRTINSSRYDNSSRDKSCAKELIGFVDERIGN